MKYIVVLICTLLIVTAVPVTGQIKEIFIGENNDFSENTDAIISPLSDDRWTKTFGGKDYDIGRSVQQISDNGYITVGSAESYGVDDVDLISDIDSISTNTFSYDYHVVEEINQNLIAPLDFEWNPDVNLGYIDTSSFFSTSEIVDFTSCAWGLTTADFDDDANTDFAALYTQPEGFRISIFYNKGNLEFMQDEVHSFSYWHPCLSDLDSGDYDNDGDIDLLFTYSEYIWYNGWAVNVNGTGKILFNNGDNEFENEKQVFWHGPGTPFDPENRINPQLTSADYDMDGDIDFLVGDNSGKVEFYKNDGAANFTSVGIIHDFGHVSWGVSSADYDNDGDIDFLVAAETEIGSFSGHVYLKRNQWIESNFSYCFDPGSGEIIADLPQQAGPSSGLGTGTLVSLDYNDDGNKDFFFASGHHAFLYIQKGDIFQPFYVCRFPKGAEGYAESLQQGGVSVGDFNNDGLDDVITGGTQGTIRLFINNYVLIDIVHPEDRWLYVFGKKKFHLKYPGQKIVIGKITVVAEELEPLQKVEFYLDGKLVYTDNEYPYEWIWNRFSFGRHTVTAVAHDADGNYGGEDKITVWKFL